jgi:ribosomal protein S18 acetylase RimI-like enzyme
MVTIALGRDGSAIVARPIDDRAALRRFLERDRLFSAYPLCDLEEGEFQRTRWGAAYAGADLVSVVAEYGGTTPQPLFVLGHPDGVAAILREVIRPRIAYVALRPDLVAAVAAHYRLDPGVAMVRMWVDRRRFRPHPSPEVRRLSPADIADLNRLYQLGFASWIPAAAVAEGIYYGIRVRGRLVSAAGTHIVAPSVRLAVVGNVFTHADYRGRGYATAVTGAVTAELLEFCDQVVLNVRADNPPALQAYRKLGYVEYCRFEERLIHRLGPPWGDLAAPLRRILGG